MGTYYYQSGTFANTGLALEDTDGGQTLTLVCNEDITANLNFNIKPNNQERTVDLKGNLTLGGNLETSGTSAVTLTSTAPTNITLPTTGTLATTANKISDFAASTSAELAGKISDETGSGLLVLNNGATLIAPVITTNGSIDVSGAGTLAIGASMGANPLSLGSATGSVNIVNDLTVSGTTTTINTSTLNVADANISMGNVGVPTDITADGGGITLLGATNKTILWDNPNDNWTSNQAWNLTSGLDYKINNVSVLNATTLGSAVVASSLTSVGTLSALNMGGNLVMAGYSITAPNAALPVFIGGGTGDDFTINTNGFVYEGDTGNVGIGTASPGGKLDVAYGAAGYSLLDTIRLGADIGATSRTDSTAKTATIGMVHYLNAEEPLAVVYSVSDGVDNRVDIGGGVALHNAATVIRFFTAANTTTAVGTLRMNINNNGIITMSAYGAGTASFDASGVLSSSSDANLKLDDGFIENGLDKIMKLVPRYFYWQDGKDINRQLGFYAQEVHAVSPETGVKSIRPDGAEAWGIYDRGITAMLVKAVQELKTKMDSFKSIT